MARVLIVDDDPQVRRFLQRTLLRAGYEVQTAPSGHAAVDMCGAPAIYDLVLSDVSMPTMDGHELARWIAVNHPACTVILMSADDTTCDACPYAPRCKVLRKPFRPGEVLSEVAGSLGLGAN